MFLGLYLLYASRKLLLHQGFSSSFPGSVGFGTGVVAVVAVYKRAVQEGSNRLPNGPVCGQ